MSGSATLFQIGRVVAAPESRMAGTTPVVEVRLVSSQGKGDKEKTQWVKGIFFGKQGDLVKDLKKGDLLGIQGDLHARAWKDNKGEPRVDLECVVSKFTFIGGKTDDATERAPNAPF